MVAWVRSLEFEGRALLLEASPGRAENETEWRCQVARKDGEVTDLQGVCVHEVGADRNEQIVEAVRERFAGWTERGVPFDRVDPVAAALVGRLAPAPGKQVPTVDRKAYDRVQEGFRVARERIQGKALAAVAAKPVAPSRGGMGFIEAALVCAIVSMGIMGMLLTYQAATGKPDDRPRLFRDLDYYASQPILTCKVRDAAKPDADPEIRSCRGSGRVRVMRTDDGIDVALEGASDVSDVGLHVHRDGLVQSYGDLGARILDALRDDRSSRKGHVDDQMATKSQWTDAYDGVAAALRR